MLAHGSKEVSLTLKWRIHSLMLWVIRRLTFLELLMNILSKVLKSADSVVKQFCFLHTTLMAYIQQAYLVNSSSSFEMSWMNLVNHNYWARLKWSFAAARRVISMVICEFDRVGEDRYLPCCGVDCCWNDLTVIFVKLVLRSALRSEWDHKPLA